MSNYNILSIDGGGLRGIVTLSIIERLDSAAPNWRKKINMYAGTSTGGLIALALAKGMEPKDIMQFYFDKGPYIFDRGLLQEIETIGNVTGPKYDSAHRLEVFKAILQKPGPNGTTTDSRLEDLSHDVLIPTFDISGNTSDPSQPRNWKAKIYHNMPTTNPADNDRSALAYVVAMSTSAAPTYFASFQGHVDGGVFANNPSMCALAQTQDERLVTTYDIDKIKMLSLGTGYYPDYIDGDESWGLAEWAPRLVNLLTDGVNDVARYQTEQMLNDGNFVRINPLMNQQIQMDDVSKMSAMQAIGNAASLSADIAKAVNLVQHW